MSYQITAWGLDVCRDVLAMAALKRGRLVAAPTVLHGHALCGCCCCLCCTFTVEPPPACWVVSSHANNTASIQKNLIQKHLKSCPSVPHWQEIYGRCYWALHNVRSTTYLVWRSDFKTMRYINRDETGHQDSKDIWQNKKWKNLASNGHSVWSEDNMPDGNLSRAVNPCFFQEHSLQALPSRRPSKASASSPKLRLQHTSGCPKASLELRGWKVNAYCREISETLRTWGPAALGIQPRVQQIKYPRALEI